MKPDYKNCQLNIVASIEKHYGEKLPFFDSIPEVDELLKGKKHVFLMVLDGMGTKIIEKNLDENSFIRKHYVKTLSTLFPSTTTCVTSAIISGKLPNETGFYGWHQYFKEFGRDIIVFKNQDYYTKERLSISLPLTRKRFYDKYDRISTYTLFPKFSIDNGYKNFHAQVDKLIDIGESSDESFTYCYYDEPDGTIHNKGTTAKKTKKVLEKLDKELQRLKDHLKEDSIVLLTADHGLIDTETIYLEDYPDIIDQLDCKPSIEARCTTFKTSNPGRFKELFNHHFPIGFELYTIDEYMKSDYVCKLSREFKFQEYLYDFVSVSNDIYNFALTRAEVNVKAHHAGSTEDEMLVPLIIF